MKKTKKLILSSAIILGLLTAGFSGMALQAATEYDGLVTVNLTNDGNPAVGTASFDVYKDANGDKVYNGGDTLVTTMDVTDGTGTFEATSGDYFFVQKTAISGYELDTIPQMVTVKDKTIIDTWVDKMIYVVTTENYPLSDIAGFETFKSVITTKEPIYITIDYWNGLTAAERQRYLFYHTGLNATLQQDGVVVDDLTSPDMIYTDMSKFTLGANTVNVGALYESPAGDASTSFSYDKIYLTASDFAKGLSSGDLVRLMNAKASATINGVNYPSTLTASTPVNSGRTSTLGTTTVQIYTTNITGEHDTGDVVEIGIVPDGTNLSDLKTAIGAYGTVPAAATLDNGSTVDLVKKISNNSIGVSTEMFSANHTMTVNLYDPNDYLVEQMDDHTIQFNNVSEEPIPTVVPTTTPTQTPTTAPTQTPTQTPTTTPTQAPTTTPTTTPTQTPTTTPTTEPTQTPTTAPTTSPTNKPTSGVLGTQKNTITKTGEVNNSAVIGSAVAILMLGAGIAAVVLLRRKKAQDNSAE